MSDQIKHECGIAFIRLLKPLDYYIKKIRHTTLWLKQAVPNDGETAQ